MYVVLIVAGVLLWAGASLLIDAWLRRHLRPDLADRLIPFQTPPSLADEAQERLRRHR
jgi:hypothetical protein